MTFRIRAHFNKLFLPVCLCLAALAPAIARAQDAPESPLTPEYLIGDAVSLSNRAYPEIEKAIQRFRNNDLAGAQEFIEQATEKYPQLPPSDVLMAKMHLLTRNARAVQFYLERAATQHPLDPESYLILADQAFIGQRTTESLALFEYAKQLTENFDDNAKRKRKFNIRILAGLAAVAERRGQWEEARGFLEKWLVDDPENALAHTRMGIINFRLDQAKEALAEFTKAREINPDMPHPFVSLGQLFYANGDVEKAQKSFEKAYSENQADMNVAQAYAEWLIQSGDLDKAKEIATAMRTQAPDSVPALQLDGIVAYMQGDSERAESALQKVLSLDPRNARAMDLLALLLIQSDKMSDKERALQYAQLNADNLGNNAQANVTRAYVLYELGRKSEAQKSLAAAGKMQIQPDSTFLIAKILVAEGQNDKAIEALEKILEQKSRLVIFRREAEELLGQLKGDTSTN